MKRLLLFGGAAEGRALLQALRSRPVAVTLSVATEYGRETLAEAGIEGIEILCGRLDAGEITSLLHTGGYGLTVDATHPYAREATANIRAAAAQAAVPCFRLQRGGSALDGCLMVDSAAGAAELLCVTDDNVLLTTGVKELGVFTAVPGYMQRLYPRVLPSVESIAQCLAHGYAQSHILAMQGPFSTALNTAVMREWNIGTVVSKDGGRVGGFAEKRDAAQALGARMIVITRPEEIMGLSQIELLREIDEWLEAGE